VVNSFTASSCPVCLSWVTVRSTCSSSKPNACLCLCGAYMLLGDTSSLLQAQSVPYYRQGHKWL
jgi:hypothetical protein